MRALRAEKPYGDMPEKRARGGGDPTVAMK